MIAEAWGFPSSLSAKLSSRDDEGKRHESLLAGAHWIHNDTNPPACRACVGSKWLMQSYDLIISYKMTYNIQYYYSLNLCILCSNTPPNWFVHDAYGCIHACRIVARTCFWCLWTCIDPTAFAERCGLVICLVLSRSEISLLLSLSTSWEQGRKHIETPNRSWYRTYEFHKSGELRGSITWGIAVGYPHGSPAVPICTSRI